MEEEINLFSFSILRAWEKGLWDSGRLGIVFSFIHLIIL